jgi:hypothetical protein
VGFADPADPLGQHRIDVAQDDVRHRASSSLLAREPEGPPGQPWPIMPRSA